jgi:hypothetical protein
MTTRKFRFDSETGQLAPISTTAGDIPRRAVSPSVARGLRLVFVVVALAVSAFVFDLAGAQTPLAGSSTPDDDTSPRPSLTPGPKQDR